MYDSMEPPFLTSQVSDSRILYQAGVMSCNCKHSSNDLMVNSLAACSYSGYVLWQWR
jgi:hypothetical protein